MNLEDFISQYTLSQILDIEAKDSQFLSLQDSRNQIKLQLWKNKITVTNLHKNCFLSLSLQNAMICYQISWSGEQYREEFSQNINKEFELLFLLYSTNQNNLSRRKNIFQTSKHNKRLHNIKYKKLEKMQTFFYQKNEFLNYSQDLKSLYDKLLTFVSSKQNNKTPAMSCKIFWYAYTAIQWIKKQSQIFPNDVPLPYDSRLKKIYEKNFPSEKANTNQIKQYYQNLSIKYDIPPLHLDSLLRIKYWHKHMK